jgi:anti-sigma factor RsiW
MSCKKIESLWPLFLSGDLKGRRLRRFEEHLAGCRDCRARRQAFDESRALALECLSKAPAPSDIERARLRKAIPSSRPPYRLAPVIAAVGAAAAAAAVALVMNWVTPEPAPDAGVDAGMEAIALAEAPVKPDRYELRMSTRDPHVKIVWVFDRNLQL